MSAAARKVSVGPDAQNINNRRLFIDGHQWAKVYGWDKASVEARCDALVEALSVVSTTPTEGVKLEAVAWRWRAGDEWLGVTRMESFANTLREDSATDEVESLVSGPQAAKRIEDLEAEVARLSSLAFGLMNGDDQ